MTHIALVHGPNLNMLGRRPSQHYGTLTLPELEAQVRAWGAERGMVVGTFQTNFEGAMLEHLHGLAGAVDGIVINPGAWTHYQYSVRDALEAVGAPFVEVHLSDVDAREDFRKISVVRDIALATVKGKGPDGYREALDILQAELAG
jgi:3-dehydroquinate dehydratase-2